MNPLSSNFSTDVVCKCKNVTKQEILTAIENGSDTVEKLKSSTNAGTGCGGCVLKLESILEESASN